MTSNDILDLSTHLRDQIRQFDDQTLDTFCDRLAQAFFAVDDLARLSRFIVNVSYPGIEPEDQATPPATDAKRIKAYADSLLQDGSLDDASRFNRLHGYIEMEVSDDA